ncbi:hypothetical protein M8J77_022691 [Diaphorina citri]|nr:hypothetical protein M8J77_022691 [Diaphorina citri]
MMTKRKKKEEKKKKKKMKRKKKKKKKKKKREKKNEKDNLGLPQFHLISTHHIHRLDSLTPSIVAQHQYLTHRADQHSLSPISSLQP